MATAQGISLSNGRVEDHCPGAFHKRYTLHNPALQAVWARFPSNEGSDTTGSAEALCMLQATCITSCTRGGALLETPVSGVDSIWPCQAGLLLQAASGSGVLLLDHPLSMPLPVLADVGVAARAHMQAPLTHMPHSYTGWGGETVIWSYQHSPLVATYNKGVQRVAVWMGVHKQLAAGFVGNFPDLPAVTPTHATPLLHPHQKLSQAGVLAGHIHGTPGVAAGNGNSFFGTPAPPELPPTSWPSAIKRPVARTSAGVLSPALFSTRPRLAGHGAGGGARRSGFGNERAMGGGSAAAPSMMPSPGTTLGLAHSPTSETCVFELICEYPVQGASSNSACFLVRDVGSSPLLLAVMCDSVMQLTLLPISYQVTRTAVSPPTPIHFPARSATVVGRPALTSSSPSMLVILTPGGEMTLCFGTSPVCTLSQLQPSYTPQTYTDSNVEAHTPEQSIYWRILPPGATDGLADDSSVTLPNDVTLKATAGEGEKSEVVIQLSSGEEVSAEIDMQPYSWLAQAVLQLLQACLSANTYTAFLAALYKDPGCLGNDPDDAWQVLVDVIGYALVPANVQPAPHSSTAAANPNNPSTPSYPEGAYHSPQTSRFAALSLASPVIARNLFVNNDTSTNTQENTAWDQLIASGLLHGASLCTTASRQGQTLPNNEHQDVRGAQAAAAAAGLLHGCHAEVLRCLHALYEDFKLDVCRWPHLQPLGLALASWWSRVSSHQPAAAAGYWEYYACDLGIDEVEAVAGLPPARSADVESSDDAQPWDIHRELGNSLKGQGLQVTPPLQDVTLMPRTTQVLLLYGVLQNGAQRCQDAYAQACQTNTATAATMTPGNLTITPSGPGATSQRKQDDSLTNQLQNILRTTACELVDMMIAAGWDCHVLDTLPNGVALPIQEALVAVRELPPPGWPPAAYALIGRQDIAATVAASSTTDTTSPSKSSKAPTAAFPHHNLAAPATVVAPFPTSYPTPGMQTAGLPAGLPVLPSQYQPPSSMVGRGTAYGLNTQERLGFVGLQTPVSSLQGSYAPPTTPQIGFQQGLLHHDLAANTYGTSGNRQIRNCSSHAHWSDWSLAHQQRLHLPSHLVPVSVLHHASKATSRGTAVTKTGSVTGTQEAQQTLQQYPRPCQLRFSTDDRLAVVERLLAGTRPVTLVLDIPEADPELPAKQQQQLLSASLRTMALAVGRGAFTLASVNPLPTEPLAIPALCLSGLTGEKLSTPVNLDLSSSQTAPGGGAAADITAWAEFHNGVASALRLVRASNGSSHAGLTPASLVFQKLESPTYTQAGILLGLGLTGHLSQLAWTDVYRYLSEQHDATTIGAMLGRAACQRGSMDALTSKMLALHLPSTHPSSFPEMEVSPLVQAAALMGMGLLYEGTCHRQMAETMLREIARQPPAPSKTGRLGAGLSSSSAYGAVTSEREGYALAAGFALGLTTLGAGRQAPGLHDLNIEARLRELLLGSSRNENDSTADMAHTTYGSTNRQAGGAAYESAALNPYRYGVDVGSEHNMYPSSLAAVLQGCRPKESAFDGQSIGSAAAPQVVLQSTAINVAITSPAASMALALMFLRTNDKQAASAFEIPSTNTALRLLRPDLIMLRVLGRNMIMWDTVQPTQEWMNSLVPPLLRGDIVSMVDRANKHLPIQPQSMTEDSQAVLLAHVYAVAGACLALGLRYAGSGSQAVSGLLKKHITRLLRAKRLVPDCQPVAGPGVAIGTRLANTGNAGMRLDKGHVEHAISVIAMALGAVMAGSGHLPTLQLLQGLSLRQHPNQGFIVSGVGINYGCHMAVNMAAGLLFMGAGTHSFMTSNLAIASLLISLYPQLPISPVDNRFHLQAFRHLYVLATEPRCAEAVDVGSQQMVYLPINLKLTTAYSDTSADTSSCIPQLQPHLQSHEKAVRRSTRSTAGGGARQPSTGGARKDVVVKQLNNGLRSMDLVAPCLLPEIWQVHSLGVGSNRYWAQKLVLRRQLGKTSGSLAKHLTWQHVNTPGSVVPRLDQAMLNNTAIDEPAVAATSHLLFVKKKANSLSYADDPSGIRSLLAQSSHASVAGKTKLELQQAATQNGGNEMITDDIARLCAMFNASSSVTGFAQSVQQLAAAMKMVLNQATSSETALGAAALLRFCMAALHECIAEEKPDMLLTHLQLYTLIQRFVDAQSTNNTALTTCELRSLHLMQQHSRCPMQTASRIVRGSLQGNKSDISQMVTSPLISPVFVEGLWLDLTGALAACCAIPKEHKSVMQALHGARANPHEDPGTGLALWQQLQRLPTIEELKETVCKSDDDDQSDDRSAIIDAVSARVGLAMFLACNGTAGTMPSQEQTMFG